MTGLHMAREMREQPGVLAALSARRSEIAECFRAVRPDPLHGTVLVARGSSDHAMAMLRERGAAVYEIADRLDAALPIPAGLAEPLAAIVAVVRAQQVALALARRRGLEPDAPRGLSKVTLTI